MLKNLITFYELATEAVDNTAQPEPERRILWATIRDRFGGDEGLIHKLTSMKFKARLYYTTVLASCIRAMTSNFLFFVSCGVMLEIILIPNYKTIAHLLT